VTSSAVISPCGQYRYRLERSIDNPDMFGPLAGKVVAFFGVNPSTADAEEDDATVRKWKGFCQRWGVSRFIVGNVFAFRATDVGKLATAEDPFGEDNFRYREQIIHEADVLVPCWGRLDKLPKKLRGSPGRLLDVLRCLPSKPAMHFGLTGCGQPKHPLMLGYDTPLTRWAA